MPLDPTDLSTLSRLLDEALDLEPVRVGAWLAALPGEHRHLAPRLRDMLADHLAQGPAGFLSDGPKLAERSAPADESIAQADDLVGPYRLIREIGRGGMGAVWLAERADGRLKRQIALKLPRLAWGAGLAERMARERDIGALLEHPNIARLYDAGVDALGRPYLALEHIDGQPLDAWCKTKGLSVEQRLRLVLQVARAVAYAHGRLVVHRDLKPSNVLVTADGQAHLLDFGIAKLLNEASPGDEQLTQQQGRVMTPHYASPEQVAGEAITVASDVYSLGVLLYEVLTGTLPIAPKRSTAAALEDAVLQGDAPLASSRVEDKAVSKALRGEVDAILAKAMQREPGRRYATADAMAQDIERHLNGETVAARPDSVSYRLRKSLRRHWVGVSAVTAVLVAMLSGSGLAVVQAQRAARAAERESSVKAFVTDVFRVNANVNMANAGVRPASQSRLLEDGAQLIEKRFSGQLEMQAELYGIVGNLCSQLGDYTLAANYALRRVEALSLIRADRTEQARAVIALASALYDARRFADAEPRARRGLELASGDLALQAEALVVLAGTHAYGGRLGDARSSLDAAQSKLLTLPAGPSVTLAKVRMQQGLVLVKENKMDEALPLYQQGVEIAQATEGSLSPTAAEVRLHLGILLLYADQSAQARTEMDRALSTLSALGGAHAARAAFEGARFALVDAQHNRSDRYAASIARIQASREELAHAATPIPQWYVPQVEFWLGALKRVGGDIAVGLPLMEANFDLLYRALDAPTDRFAQAGEFGRALQQAGRHELADRWLREVIVIRRQIGEADHPWAVTDHLVIAENLMMAGRLEQALGIVDAIPDPEPVRGEADRYDINRYLVGLHTRLLLAQGDGRGALEQLERSSLPTNPDPAGRSNDARLRGEALCAAGHPERGLAVWANQATGDDIETTPFPSAPWVARSHAVTGLCALAAGRGGDAQQLADQARAAFTAQPGVSAYYKAPLFKLERALGLRRPAV